MICSMTNKRPRRDKKDEDFTTYSQKWLKVAVAFALVTAPALSVTPVFQPRASKAAAPATQAIPFGQTTPGTGSIEVLVLQDDKKTKITERVTAYD